MDSKDASFAGAGERDSYYRTLFEEMVQGVVYHDAQGQIIDANPAAEHILGLTLAEMCGRTSHDKHWQAISEDGAPFPGAEHPAVVALRTGQPVRDVLMGVYHPLEGIHHWILVSATPEFRPGETVPYRAFAVFQDVTERKATEDALKRSEERYLSIVQHIPHIIYRIDRQGRLVFANQAFLNLYHVPLEQLLGKTSDEFFPKDLAVKYQADDEWVMANNQMFYAVEENVNPATGEKSYVEVIKIPLHDEDGQVVGLQGIFWPITERVRAEEALRESEMTAKALLNATTDAVFLADLNGTVLAVNESFSQRYHKPISELVGTKMDETTRPEVARHRQEVFETVIRTGQPVRFEDERHGLWLENSFFPVVDENGVVTKVAVYSRDISQRRKTEMALRESEERYRIVAEQTGQLLYDYNVTSGKILWSGAIMPVTGYSPGEFQVIDVLRWGEMLHPEDRPRVLVELDSAAKTGRPFHSEYRFKRKSGTYIIVEDRGAFLKDGGGVARRMLGSMSDVTARRQAERVLQQYTQRLERLRAIDNAILVSASPQEIAQSAVQHIRNLLACDRVSVVTFDDAEENMTVLASASCDDATLELGQTFSMEAFGILPHLKTGRPYITGDISRLSNLPPLRQRLKKEGMRSVANVPLIVDERIIGALSLADASANVFNREKIEIIQEVATSLSVALQQARLREKIERHAMELDQHVQERTAQLEAANRELEAFSYSVSHDLRAPLRSLSGFSQLLVEEYTQQLDPRGIDYLNRIHFASQRMSDLIDNLLKLSRLSRSVMRQGRVDLRRLGDEILQELRSAAPERQMEWVAPHELWVYGDEPLLRVVLSNLLNNAWKFTSRTPVGRIELGIQTQSGQTVFFVRDNGAGFDMAYVDKLFGAFQRLHSEAEYPGTGIGLAMVQRIIHRHGGKIRAEGAVGQGATFYFTLPIRPQTGKLEAPSI